MENQAEFLETLRQKIIDEVGPLITDSQLSPTEKFNAYYAIAQATQTNQALQTAFDAAHEMSEQSEKSTALLDLLDLVSSIQQESTSDSELDQESANNSDNQSQE